MKSRFFFLSPALKRKNPLLAKQIEDLIQQFGNGIKHKKVG